MYPFCKTHSYHFLNATHKNNLTLKLRDIFDKAFFLGYDSIVFVFIGTDRSTGDSLGPIIGHKFDSMRSNRIIIIGDLENPVHAKNLNEKISVINRLPGNPFTVAVDASLGNSDRVGMVTLANGPVYPGSGLNKTLPPIGDIHITGIVNSSGFMDFIVLQNTRLSFVMKLADFISDALTGAVSSMIASSTCMQSCKKDISFNHANNYPTDYSDYPGLQL